MVLATYILLGIIFEIFLLLDPIGSFNFGYPDINGEDLIDEPVNSYSPVGILIAIYFISIIILAGIGFIIKAVYSEGIIKKKLLWLSIANIGFMIFGMFEAFLRLGAIIIVFRLGMIFSFWAFYYALREEPEQKVKYEKEIKVEGDLFRITQYKKEDLTEEEVSISKEKKVCLVCKGSVRKYDVYICDCNTFYCEKCAHALEDLENACWVCGAPIDESKPVKPFKKEQDREIEDIEIKEKKFDD